MRSTKLYDVHNNICIFMHMPQICYKMLVYHTLIHSYEAKLSSKKIKRCNTENVNEKGNMWWQMFYSELNKNNPTERKNEQQKKDPTIKTQYTNDFGYWQIFTVMYASIFLHPYIVNDWWYIITLHFTVCSLSMFRNENI